MCFPEQLAGAIGIESSENRSMRTENVIRPRGTGAIGRQQRNEGNHGNRGKRGKSSSAVEEQTGRWNAFKKKKTINNRISDDFRGNVTFEKRIARADAR